MSQNPKEECMNPLFPGDPSTCQFDPCQCAENWDAESAPCPVCGSEERNKSGILLCECPCPTTLGARRKIAEEMQAMDQNPYIAAVKKELRRQMELSLSQGPIFMSLEEVIALLDSHDKLEAKYKRLVGIQTEDESKYYRELARANKLETEQAKLTKEYEDLLVDRNEILAQFSRVKAERDTLAAENARLKVELQEWIDNRDNLEMNYQGLVQVKQDVCRENARLRETNENNVANYDLQVRELRERLEAAIRLLKYCYLWVPKDSGAHGQYQAFADANPDLEMFKYANPQQSADTGPVAPEKGGDNDRQT